jgi:hypothetical protein
MEFTQLENKPCCLVANNNSRNFQSSKSLAPNVQTPPAGAQKKAETPPAKIQMAADQKPARANDIRQWSVLATVKSQPRVGGFDLVLPKTTQNPKDPVSLKPHTQQNNFKLEQTRIPVVPVVEYPKSNDMKIEKMFFPELNQSGFSLRDSAIFNEKHSDVSSQSGSTIITPVKVAVEKNPVAVVRQLANVALPISKNTVDAKAFVENVQEISRVNFRSAPVENKTFLNSTNFQPSGVWIPPQVLPPAQFLKQALVYFEKALVAPTNQAVQPAMRSTPESKPIMMMANFLSQNLQNKNLPAKDFFKLLFNLLGRPMPKEEVEDLEGMYALWRKMLKRVGKKKEISDADERKKRKLRKLGKRRSQSHN